MKQMYATLVTIFIVGCVTTMSVPKMSAPQTSAIGIQIKIQAPIGIFSAKPDQVYFVKLDNEINITQNQIIPSNFTKGGQAYLLNAEPGKYAVVAAFSNGLADTSFTTYFSKELIEATKTDVGRGEFAFMGNYVVKQPFGLKGADPIQIHYVKSLSPGSIKSGFDYLYRGEVSKVKRDSDARTEFITKAKDDLAEGGWGSILSTPVDYSINETGINGVKKLVEQLETSKAYSLSPDQLTHKISQAKKELDTRFDSHPDDIEAIILSVRLSIIEGLNTPIVFSKGNKPADPKKKYISQHSILDRALKLQPDSAEAHYWKARLYGIRSPTIGEADRLEKKPIDLEKAIQFARKAVQLDPKNIGYREAFALYLVDDQHREEALEVMSTAVTDHNPIYVLLKDIDAFPVPEGAIFLKTDSQSFGDMQMSRGRIVNYSSLRVQMFIVPMTASKIEAFYQRQWPKFKFFNQRPGGPFAQILMFKAGGLRPIDSMSEAEKWTSLPDAIALSVNELLNPTEEQRKMTPAGQPLPTSLGEIFSYMYYVNYRRIN